MDGARGVRERVLGQRRGAQGEGLGQRCGWVARVNIDILGISELKWTAATAAKSLQSCLTLCDPIDSSPHVSSLPGILQARILEWVAISFSSACK